MSMFAVARLDLKRLYVRPFAWTLGAVTLAAMGLAFTLLLQHFLDMQPKLAGAPESMGFTDWVVSPQFLIFTVFCLFLAPLITMFALAGERRAHTLPLLFATGLSSTRIVLGKFVAALIYLWLLLILIALIPVTLAHATSIDWGQFGAALLGCALCVGAFVAIGIACSAFASHPALAAASSLAIGASLYWFLDWISGWAVDRNESAGWISYLSLQTHLTPFMHGLVRSMDVIYFLLLIALSLAFAARRLAADRVRG